MSYLVSAIKKYGKEYTVIVTEPYMSKDVCCYIWAILKEKSLCQ